jgi:glycerophosphoryl diester phosphodiesterase
MKDLTWLRTHDIAHRGLYQKDQSIPENSIAAFKSAISKGYSIEFDVNVLKDGTVLSFHDSDLKRICGIDQKLSDLVYDDVKELKLFQTEEKIPRLKDVLEFVRGRVPLLIELKPKGDITLLCERVMKDLADYPGVYAIFSFHPKVQYWFKKNHPNVIRGQIAEFFSKEKLNPIMKYLLKTMFFNRFTKPDFISYGIHDMPNAYLDRYMKKKMTIISYAAKNQSELDFVRSRYHNAVFEHFIPKK